MQDAGMYVRLWDYIVGAGWLESRFELYDLCSEAQILRVFVIPCGVGGKIWPVERRIRFKVWDLGTLSPSPKPQQPFLASSVASPRLSNYAASPVLKGYLVDLRAMPRNDMNDDSALYTCIWDAIMLFLLYHIELYYTVSRSLTPNPRLLTGVEFCCIILYCTFIVMFCIML